MIKAAETFENQTKRARGKGANGGELGPATIKVLKALFQIVDYKSGRLEPSYDYIAWKAFVSRSSVAKAIKRLRHYGFLDWLRRAEETDVDGQGPQVRQVSNAYWFSLRGIAAAMVKRLMGKAPPPDDDLVRRRHDRAELRRMENSLDLPELARLLIDGALGEALASLGALIGSGASPRGALNPAQDRR
ncbi:MAG: RNA replicase [Allosphingosinicella sp.]